MKRIAISLFVILCWSAQSEAQNCSSIAAASYGGWKPIATAPRDGRTVEVMQTYGVAPWFGLYKWSNSWGEWRWVDATNPLMSVAEQCLFWREYKDTGKPYVDPTNGAQNSVAYWCARIQRPYDSKRDRCL